MASPETKTQTTETQNVLDWLKLDGKLTSKEKQKMNEMALNPKNKEALQKSLWEIKIWEKTLVDYLKTNDAKADWLKPEEIWLVQLFLKLDGKYTWKIDWKIDSKNSRTLKAWWEYKIAATPKVEEKKPEAKKVETPKVEPKKDEIKVAPVKVEKAPETLDLFGSVDLDKFTKRQFRELYESKGVDGFKKLAKLDPSDAERLWHPAVSSEYGITTFDSSHILSAKKIMKLYDADKSDSELKNKSLEKFLWANTPKVAAVEKAPEQDKNKELVDRLSKIWSKWLSMEDLWIKYNKKTGYSIEWKNLKSESIQKWLWWFTYIWDFNESNKVTVSNIKMDSKGVLNMEFNKSYKNEAFSISSADDKAKYARLMDAPQVSELAFKSFVTDKVIASISKLEWSNTSAKPYTNPDTWKEMPTKSPEKSTLKMPASKAATPKVESAPEKKVESKKPVEEKDLKA